MPAGSGMVPVTVVGEVLVDLLTDDTRAAANGSLALRGRFGGSPANVAVGLGRLGVPASFAGRLSNHGRGPWLARHLADNGVDLSPSVDAPEPCTLADVTLDAAGRATYAFYGAETADWHWRREELPAPSTLAAVHTGSLATALAPGAAVVAGWVADLRAAGGIAISYDPNVRPAVLPDIARYRQVVAPLLDAAHLVKVSEEDLRALYPDADPHASAVGWLDRGPAVVVVTAGADGAVALHRDGRRLHRPAPPTEVIDTVGAGDAFTAGLLAWLSARGCLTPEGLDAISDVDLCAALDQANLVAALTCQRPGADPPRADELHPVG